MVLLVQSLLMMTGYTENWSRKIFVIDSVLRTNPWMHKIKDLNGKTKMLLSKLSEPDIHIRDKAKTLLDLLNYATKSN